MEQFALWSGHETASPELYSASLSARVRFVSYTVDAHHWQAIGHGMTALYCDPCLPLPFLFGRCIGTLITDGCGIDEQIGSLQGHEPCSLGVPLVPAYLYTQEAHAGGNGMEAKVAGSEVELLIVSRVIGDVHLTVTACHGSVLLKDDSRVVVKACCAFLEQTGHQHHSVFPSQGSIEVRGRAGDGDSQLEVVGALHLAEVEAVMQFLQHHQFGSHLSHSGYALCQTFPVG